MIPSGAIGEVRTDYGLTGVTKGIRFNPTPRDVPQVAHARYARSTKYLIIELQS
jgi:hypothetical protein